MNFTELIGRPLKSDEVIEVLENFDMKVTYDFDRSNEGMADVYWAASKEAGFQFRFNADQVLDVVFIYLAANKTFSAFDRSLLDGEVFETFDEVEQAGARANTPYKTSAGKPGAAEHKSWIKLDHGSHTAHYKFKEGKVSALTLSLKE
jgi:hypothetical protein